jgi:hypothetical protein
VLPGQADRRRRLHVEWRTCTHASARPDLLDLG